MAKESSGDIPMLTLLKCSKCWMTWTLTVLLLMKLLQLHAWSHWREAFLSVTEECVKLKAELASSLIEWICLGWLKKLSVMKKRNNYDKKAKRSQKIWGLWDKCLRNNAVSMLWLLSKSRNPKSKNRQILLDSYPVNWDFVLVLYRYQEPQLLTTTENWGHELLPNFIPIIIKCTHYFLVFSQ